MTYQKNFTTDYEGKTFPKELPENETKELLVKYYNGNKEAKRKLTEHNLRLVVYVAKKFRNTGVEMEELISTGTIGLIKGIETFNIEKETKLATYVTRCIENEILIYLRKNQKYTKIQSLEETLTTDWEGNELYLKDIMPDENAEFEDKIINRRYNAQLKDAMKKLLTEREYTILSYLYGLEGEYKTQKQLEKMLGISQSLVSRIEKKALLKLRQNLDKTIDERPLYQIKPKNLELVKQYQFFCNNVISDELLLNLINGVLKFLKPEDNIEAKIENAILNHLFQLYKTDPNNTAIKLCIYNLFQKKYPNLSAEQKIKVIQTIMEKYDLSENDAVNLSIA